MDEINKLDGSNSLERLTDDLLEDVRESIDTKDALELPIAELSLLGTSVADLLPAFRTITETRTFNTAGLYKLMNAAPGDTLKMAKNGNAYGALKTSEGKSKFLQIREVGGLTTTREIITPIDPTTMAMAMMLYSIEKDLDEIIETQKAILSFLEIENESQIEADVETLVEMVNNYKYNWDNKLTVANSHNVVLDIKNRSRKNILAFQKKIEAKVSKKQVLSNQGKLNSSLSDLVKKFKYYRLSLYIFTLASLMEIMLAGNFKEEYIIGTKNEIEKLSDQYREYFMDASLYLEKISKTGVEANLFKGLGLAGKKAGKLIGSIPLVNKGPIDEFLQDKGDSLYNDGIGFEKNLLRSFAILANPETRILIEKIEAINYIYNGTKEIYFDKDSIFFLS